LLRFFGMLSLPIEASGYAVAGHSDNPSEQTDIDAAGCANAAYVRIEEL
jgi:hypothetical protein